MCAMDGISRTRFADGVFSLMDANDEDLSGICSIDLAFEDYALTDAEITSSQMHFIIYGLSTSPSLPRRRGGLSL